MAKGVAHAGKDKDLSSGNALENERRGWDEDAYRRKNLKPTNNYDWSRHDLNFEVVDGRIVPLGSQETSLYQRYQNLLKELNFKEYKAGATNKQNTYVELILSGSTDRMQLLAFGDQKVDYERNPATWHNWHVRRMRDIEEWALDTYNFVCQRYGRESVIGFEVHLDETEPHAHVNIVPVAIKKQRGNVGGYVKVDADGNLVTYTRGKHVGEVIKLSKGKYDALPDEKKKDYRPAVRGTVKTISFAEHFGDTRMERSKKMSELHDEYHRQVGSKWGLERGDVWKDLPEEERRKRRRRTKEEAYEEKRAREAKEKAVEEAKAAALMVERQNATMEENAKTIEEQNATIDRQATTIKANETAMKKMTKASLFDRMFHSGLSADVRRAFEEKDEAHKEELHQATMATYSDGSPVKWEGGGQLTWKEWAEWLQKQRAKDKDKLAAEKAAAVEQATAAAKAEYGARLEKEMKKLKVGHDKEIQELKNKHQKELLAFFPSGLPIKWTFGPKNGQQMTKDERIGYLDNLLGKYERKCNDSEGRLKLAKDLFMSTLDLNFLKAVLDILALAKAGAKALTKGLMEFLLMTMKAMDTLERRQKHVDRAFQYVRIFAAMEGLNYSENFLAPLREDAKRIADGTWDEYHQERADRTMENINQGKSIKRGKGRGLS